MGIDSMANIVDAETEDKFILKNKESMHGGPTYLLIKGKRGSLLCYIFPKGKYHQYITYANA